MPFTDDKSITLNHPDLGEQKARGVLSPVINNWWWVRDSEREPTRQNSSGL
jgi:hypothetical protein